MHTDELLRCFDRALVAVIVAATGYYLLSFLLTCIPFAHRYFMYLS